MGGGQWSDEICPPGITRPKDEDPLFWPPTNDNGSPFITYPGKDEVLPSVRFARFRDGLQDYDYLTMLERLDPQNPLLNKIRKNGNDYYGIAEQILSTRHKLATELELIYKRRSH